jgi:hypothetical protein
MPFFDKTPAKRRSPASKLFGTYKRGFEPTGGTPPPVDPHDARRRKPGPVRSLVATPELRAEMLRLYGTRNR